MVASVSEIVLQELDDNGSDHDQERPSKQPKASGAALIARTRILCDSDDDDEVNLRFGFMYGR